MLIAACNCNLAVHLGHTDAAAHLGHTNAAGGLIGSISVASQISFCEKPQHSADQLLIAWCVLPMPTVSKLDVVMHDNLAATKPQS